MRIISMIILLPLAFACSSKKADKEANAAKENAANPAATPEVPAFGLAAKDNDPAVVTLAKAAMTCKADGTRLEWNCEGFKAWRDAMDKAEFKLDQTLVNFLDDPDEKVRFLGASGLKGFTLDGNYHGYAEDPAQAKRVLAATQKEKSTLVGDALAKALGKVNVAKLGMTEDVAKLMSEHELMDVRLALIETVAYANKDAMFGVLLPLAKSSTDDKIRGNAQRAFHTNIPNGKHAEVCQMWLDGVDDKDASIGGYAADNCAREALCKDHWDKLFDKLDARAKAGALSDSGMLSAAESIHDQAEATPPQKARAKAVAQATLKNGSNHEYARAKALDFLVKTGDKGVAKKFKSDPHGLVKDAAERALQK